MKNKKYNNDCSIGEIDYGCLIPTIIIILIIVGDIIIKINSYNYDDKQKHCKVDIELYYTNGTKSIKTFTVQCENTDSFKIFTVNSGLFRNGFPSLHVFQNYNSWSGSHKRIADYVVDFKILKVY